MEVEDWSNLLPELIEIISRKLTNYADYVRFRAVCVNWCSNLSPTPPYFQFPRLMLPFEPHNENRCDFFSLLDNKIIHELNIPNTYHAAHAHCCGSSQGWLLLIEERSPNLFLFNPLTGSQIHLPPLTAFPDVLDFNILNVHREYCVILDNKPYKCGLDRINDRYIRKFSLSSKNPSEDYVIVAITGFEEKLVFCKKGDVKWTIIEDATVRYCSYKFQDVIYYEGLFYAVNSKRCVAICDFSSSSPLVTIIEPSSSTYPEESYTVDDESYTIQTYLVADSFGELLLVDKFVYDEFDDDYFYQTEYFIVFRLDSSKPKWEQVKSLDDCMLFLGTNSSLCLSANDFPAAACQGNCIYFTRAGMYDRSKRWKHDSGVFNIENNNIKALPCCSSTGNDQILLPPLLWLTRN